MATVKQEFKRGNIIVISAPSGAGKTTLCRALLRRYPDILYSVSTTTRKPRLGEKDGVDYHFMDRQSFIAKLKDGSWAEWAMVHDHYYGTSAAFLDRAVASGRDVLLDIDVQGTRQILERYPEAVTIFIMPPSLEALRKRLEGRGTDSPDTIERRIANAREEMAQKGIYRHVIANDNLDTAVERLVEVVGGYRKHRNMAADRNAKK